MLYNRSAVKNRKPVTKDQNTLTNKVSQLWNIQKSNFDEIEKFRASNSKAKTEMGYIRSMALTVARLIRHEDLLPGKVVRPKEGFRCPDTAFHDGKGHCIEINLALYSVLKRGLPGLKTKFMMGKNPKHCKPPVDADEIGIHMMVYFELEGRPYFADSVSGEVYHYEGEEHFHSTALLSRREFASFFLTDTAEELSYFQGDHDKALLSINYALYTDPNNYVAFVQNGETRRCQGLHDNAEKALNAAINIAPDLMDTWKAYGDYLNDTYISKKYAKEVYSEAARKETDDFQVASSLEIKLNELKMLEEADKVWLKSRELFKRKKLSEPLTPLFTGGEYTHFK